MDADGIVPGKRHAPSFPDPALVSHSPAKVNAARPENAKPAPDASGAGKWLSDKDLNLD